MGADVFGEQLIEEFAADRSIAEEDVMLERCYTSPVTLRRLAEGAAGPFLDGFARELFGEGYSADGCGRHVFTAAHLGEWTTPRHVALADLDEAILRRFVQHLARCRCRGGRRAWDARAPFQAQRFLRYLRETGVVASRAPGPQRSALVVELVAWLRDQRRLAETTVARIVRVVQALLDTVGDEPERWDAAGVRAFVSAMCRSTRGRPPAS